MPMVTLHKVGEGNLYHMHVLDAVDPGFGGGRPGGVDPGWGQGRPGGHPDQGLPGHGHPGNRPPGSGSGIPDNELPDHPPPTLAPGYTIVMVRGPHGKWEYAFIDPGQPPPKPLPPGNVEHPGNRPPGSGPPNLPSQGLPGGQPHPGGGPMPGQPPQAGMPLPPTPQPR